MKTYRFTLTVLGLLSTLAVSPAVAWNEPDAFVGIPWGASPETGLAALRARAMDALRIPPTCTTGRYAGGTQTSCKATLLLGSTMLTGDFRFPESGFAWAFGPVPSFTYDNIRALFIERYGPPTSTREDPVTTRGGASLQNETLEWLGERVVIRLTRFAGSITNGSFEILTRATEDARAQDRKTTQQKGAGSL